MVERNIKVDLKKLANSELVHSLSKHLTTYEKRVKDIVRNLDLRSRDAREKSKLQLDKFAVQLKKTRTEVEKRVLNVLNQEAKNLNQRFNVLFDYLKSVSNNEKLAKKTASPKKRAPKARPAGSSTAAKKATAALSPSEGLTSASVDSAGSVAKDL